MTTIHTGISLRDAHLRSHQFFDAARYPKMTFRSTRIDQVDDATWEVTGDLTIKDITSEVTLETVYEGREAAADGSIRAAFIASTVLSRREFGLGMSGGGVIVSDRATVVLEIAAVHAGGPVT